MEGFIRVFYTLLILVGSLHILYFLINQDWFMRIIIGAEKKLINWANETKEQYKKLMRKTIFREDKKLFKYYTKLLRYSKFSVELFFNIKVILALATLIICILVKVTNIIIFTDELYSKYQFEQDLILQNYEQFSEETTRKIHEFKKLILRETLKMYDERMFKSMDKNLNQTYIENIINGLNNETPISTESLANEVYYKLLRLYEVQQIGYGYYLLIIFAVFFIPELLMYLFNFFVKVDSVKELSFLKRLIIMNGSIKPVDFIEVLKGLIKKSTYYKKTLEEIQDKNQKNYLPNTQIYLPYIQKSKSLTEKLFFEKLDEANNYDFDQAILNIKNEFNLDKRTQARKIKKTVETIHILGIVGFMFLIVVVVMYLILPWMDAYKMDNIM